MLILTLWGMAAERSDFSLATWLNRFETRAGRGRPARQRTDGLVTTTSICRRMLAGWPAGCNFTFVFFLPGQ